MGFVGVRFFRRGKEGRCNESEEPSVVAARRTVPEAIITNTPATTATIPKKRKAQISKQSRVLEDMLVNSTAPTLSSLGLPWPGRAGNTSKNL